MQVARRNNAKETTPWTPRAAVILGNMVWHTATSKPSNWHTVTSTLTLGDSNLAQSLWHIWAAFHEQNHLAKSVSLQMLKVQDGAQCFLTLPKGHVEVTV